MLGWTRYSSARNLAAIQAFGSRATILAMSSEVDLGQTISKVGANSPHPRVYGHIHDETRKQFSSSAHQDEPPGNVEAVHDSLLDETMRIIDLVQTNSPDRGTVDQSKVDWLMEKWIHRASSGGGLSAAKKSLELLHALEQNLDNPGTSSLVPDTAVYNMVLQAYVSSSRGEEYEQNHGERNEAAEAASSLLNHMITNCRESANKKSLIPAPTTKTFNAVINAWAKSKSKDAGKRAEEIFALMEQWMLECRRSSLPEAVPNGRTLCAVMDAWANSGAVGAADRVHAILEVAIERHKKVVKDGCAPFGVVMKPSVIMFNTAINAWAKPTRDCMHGPKKAEDLVRWMDDLNKSGALGARDEYDEDDAGLAPNTRSFTSIINAWAESEQYERDGKCAEQAEQILKGMIDRYVDRGEDVKPNVVTFTACIKAWSLSIKNPDFCNRAQALYDRMVELYRQTQDGDFKPNVYTCNHLMGAWGKSRDNNSAERAEAVLNNMLNFCEPDMHSFNIVIDAYAKNRDAWGAYTVFEKLEKNASLTPDIVSYNSTLNALAKDPRTAPEADALLRRMITEGNVLPDRLSYTCVINAWSIYRSHGKLNCARNVATLLQTMLDEYKTNKKLKPDVTTFTSAIMACGNTTSRREDKLDALKFAIRTFELMKQSDEFDNPNYLTYSAMIRVCSKLAEGRERVFLLENVFRESCEQGMLSLVGLNMFKNATEFAVHRRYAIQGKDVTVPPEWCRNVRFTDRPKSTK